MDGMCAYSSAGWQRVLFGWVVGAPQVHFGSIFSTRFFNSRKGNLMNNIVYIVGAIVIIVAILSFFGLR